MKPSPTARTKAREVVRCSYCHRPAPYMGVGQDGDLYCGTHTGLSLYGVILVTGD